MSNNNKTDYGELFCEAIDTIVAERLNAVAKDITVLCTVVDDSKRKEGKYIVTETNAQTKFEAFSDNTEYRNDNNVYVTIPEGDMNQAKFIIGKKQKDEVEQAYTYTRPFDTIVDVSGNLITAEIPVDRTGLVANEPDADGYDDGYQTITLWTYNTEALTIVADKGEELKDFTRLGIKGEFRSWLSQFYIDVGGKSVAAGTKEGSYGLRLRIKTINENVVEEENKEGYYDLYLDAQDMNGNPYAFSTFYSQEKVFNIENIGKIVSMELQFYEKPETFINDVNGDLIKWQDFLGNKINPNLFVKDCYVCIGYDVATFEDDQVTLYTLDDSTYKPNATELENQKLVQLRWVNDFGNKIKVVNETDNLNADVRWYRYQLGAPSPDEYAGYHWTRVNDKVTVTQSAPIEEIKKIESYQLVFHYIEPGVSSTRNQANEQTYTENFIPEYKVPKTRNQNKGLANKSDYSILSNWTDECLQFYNITNPDFINVGYIGQSTGAITRQPEQTWYDIVKQGFIFHGPKTRSVTDFYTGEVDSSKTKGCVHRIGFWERLTFAWRIYWLENKSFDKLLQDKYINLWKNGGNKSTGIWNDIGYWGELKGHSLYEMRYVNNSTKPISLDTGVLINNSSTGDQALGNAFTLFTDSFGEWEYVEDKYGMLDYVPVDKEIYNFLWEAIDELFYKMDNPTYQITLKPNGFSYLFNPDITLQEERLKAIILYEGDVLRSNTLYFYNEVEVPSQPTINAMSAAEIITHDASDGNYFIYDIGNSIKNYADSTQVRELDLYFNGAQLTIADEVEWLIPTKNTMIVLDDAFKGATFDEESMPGWCKITRKGGGEKGDDITGSTKQQYRIKSYWSQDDVNNTIYCTIRQYGVDYPVTKEFSFGPSGTSGTDCTFVLDFENGVSALTIGNPRAVIARARLYDYNNKLVDLTNYTINWNIFSGLTENAGTKTNLIPTEHNDTREIQLKSIVTTVPTDNYDILQATVTDFGDYELTAYLPLPIKANETYKYIEGATKLIYNSAGNIDNYYKDPYKIYYLDGEVITSTFGTWTINNGVAGDVNYIPHLVEIQDRVTNVTGYELIATNVYVPETCTQVAVNGSIDGQLVWSQPLLIMQNRYPSAMINEWDGSLKIDEANNAILAAKMVAGRKEDDNTFSGVMMGSWYGNEVVDPASDKDVVEQYLEEHTGIYGFNKGVASFGFRDNGTAFIGKPGSGRIEFDGEKGVITSNRFTNEQGGLYLDLDDGLFHAMSPTTVEDYEGTIITGNLIIDAGHPTTPFSIGGDSAGGQNNSFYINWDGTFKATAGNIGPWVLNDKGFTSTEGDIYLYADGGMVMGYGDDKIRLIEGQITIGRSQSSNQIILNANDGVIIGKNENMVQIKDGTINIGDFSEKTDTSEIKNQIQITNGAIVMGDLTTSNGSNKITINPNNILMGEGTDTISIRDGHIYIGEIPAAGEVAYHTKIYNIGIDSLSYVVYYTDYYNSMTKAGSLAAVTSDYGTDSSDVTGSIGIGLCSAAYDAFSPTTEGSILKVTDYHIGGTTAESTFIIDSNSASIGMVAGVSGLTNQSGHVICNESGVNIRGGDILFYQCSNISFTTGERWGDITGPVTIDFSTVNAKNLYAVLA